MIEYLCGRTLLLVVDNCEHVLAPAARLVAEIMQQSQQTLRTAMSARQLQRRSGLDRLYE